LSDSQPESLKPDSRVADEVAEVADKVADKLHNELCYLRSENESLRQELKATNKQLAEWDKELDQLHARNGDLGLEVQMLQSELEAVKSDRPEIQEAVPTVADFPEPADLLNRLKARRKKSGANLADMEVVLEILETHRAKFERKIGLSVI
jgi:chromosome segregation ATPase